MEDQVLSEVAITEQLLAEDRTNRGASGNRPTNDSDNEMQDNDPEAPLLGETESESGVHKTESVAYSWSREELTAAYICVFLVFFVNSLQQQTTGNLSAYVTSDFHQLGLLSAVNVVSSIIGGVVKLPIAKLIDVWGRMEGYVLMVFFTILGLVMTAICKNIETYAAAQVFYTVGYNGVAYVLTVFMADTSSLRNRALMFAFSQAPWVFTTFLGPATAEYFYTHSGWRWGHAVWAIVLPACSLPFVIILGRKQRKHRRAVNDRAVRLRRRHEFRQLFWHYFWEVDAIGLFLLCVSFTLILLVLALGNSSPAKWREPGIITMLVLGVTCFLSFGVHERYYARKCFIPIDHLLNPTIFGACALSCTTFISFYCWDLYFRPYLQVVHNLSISNSGYVANIFSVGASLWAVVVGLAVRYTNRFKWLALYFGVPLYILGTGLMIHFRTPHTNVGWIVMCQIFVACAGGTLMITEEMAVMASSKDTNMAAVLAFLGLFSSLGGGIGQAISGAIYMSSVRSALQKYLPESLKSRVDLIAGSLVEQLRYPVGTPERDGIVNALAHTQRTLVTTGTCVVIISFLWVAIWKDIKVGSAKASAGGA